MFLLRFLAGMISCTRLLLPFNGHPTGPAVQLCLQIAPTLYVIASSTYNSLHVVALRIIVHYCVLVLVNRTRALTMPLALPVAECPTCSLFFLCQTSHQAPTRRNRRAQGLVAAAGPPDDFIDTTFVEEEGSTYVGVDFERQELRVIFETMDKNNIYYKMLAEDQIVSKSWCSRRHVLVYRGYKALFAPSAILSARLSRTA